MPKESGQVPRDGESARGGLTPWGVSILILCCMEVLRVEEHENDKGEQRDRKGTFG